MGACFDEVQFDGKLSRKLVKAHFDDHCETLAYDNGHSYSGCLNMTSGLEFHDKTFKSQCEAYEYVLEHCEKWRKAIAVRIESDDVSSWYIGGMCSS